MKVYCKGEKEPSVQNLQPLSVRPTFCLGNIQTAMDSFALLSLVNLNICRSVSLNRMNGALGTVREMCYKRALFLLVLHIKTPYFIEISKCLSLFPQFKIIDSWLFTFLTPSSPHTQSTIEIRHLFYCLLLISVVIHTVQQEHSILRTPKLSLVLSTIR